MRRKDKEIIEINEKLEIIKRCKYCRLGLSENNYPYVVPLNYGFTYENNNLTLYFHSALEGRKLNIIKENKKACFEIDCDTKLIEREIPCNYSYEFKSIMGFGEIVILENINEKIKGLSILMKHQTGNDTKYNFNENELNKIIVYKLLVNEFTGKQKIL